MGRLNVSSLRLLRAIDHRLPWGGICLEKVVKRMRFQVGMMHEEEMWTAAANPFQRDLLSGHWAECPPILALNRLFSSGLRRAHEPYHFASSHRCYSSTASPLKTDSELDLPELADIDWDNLGFALRPTDYMYTMKCSRGEDFSDGELQRFGNIELSPSSGVLNYGQGLFEGLKAYRKKDGDILLFRPEEHALRLKAGADRMCMSCPSVEQFLEAVKLTVLSNKRWIPPFGKGALYIRPLLMGSGAVLGLAPAPEYTFLIFVSPVGNYFKEGVAPINLLVESKFHRAAPGGTGGVKTIGNYAAVLKAQAAAKAKGYSDVLYLDSVHKRYLEEVSSCNVFVVKDNIVSTPATQGTILPGITRKSILDVARSQGFQVEERPIPVDELLEADEVFCTGTAVVVSPVGSITYLGRRVTFGIDGYGRVSKLIHSALTSLQMGLIEDKMGWTVKL